MTRASCEVGFEAFRDESFLAVLALPEITLEGVAFFASILCLRFEGRVLIFDIGWSVLKIFFGFAVASIRFFDFDANLLSYGFEDF